MRLEIHVPAQGNSAEKRYELFSSGKLLLLAQGTSALSEAILNDLGTKAKTAIKQHLDRYRSTNSESDDLDDSLLRELQEQTELVLDIALIDIQGLRWLAENAFWIPVLLSAAVVNNLISVVIIIDPPLEFAEGDASNEGATNPEE
jgi:hypothetical protein